MDILETLHDKFSKPLADGYKRRIIFWQDPDGQFASQIDEISIPDVKVIKLTGSNNFAVKMLLCHDDLDSNYLVYNPITYMNNSDNWLYDIECYSEEFRADLMSLRMSDLSMPQNGAFREVMKMYTKFFESQDRAEKFKKLGTDYVSHSQVHLDVLAVLSGAASNDANSILKALLLAGTEENAVASNIEKFGNIDVFKSFLKKYTGFTFEDELDIKKLVAHILITALSSTLTNKKFYNGIESYVSPAHSQSCYSFINEWMNSSEDRSELYELCSEIEEMLDIPSRLDTVEISDLLSSDCLPCINENILKRYMSEIAEDVVKVDEILSVTETRRTLKWYKRNRTYFEGLYYAAKIQQFYLEHQNFHAAEYLPLWKSYQTEYYVMDTYYRKFHTAFASSEGKSSTSLDNEFIGVAEYIEKIYKNEYLSKLLGKWTSLVKDDLESSGELKGVKYQKDFYNNMVRTSIKNGGKIFVIVSDALRYEVAAELKDFLVRETKGQAELSCQQSVLPSVTKFGMAALLPHRNINVVMDDAEKKYVVLNDDMSTSGTENRSKILSNWNPDSIAVQYADLMKLTKSDKRELIAGKNIIYIYHNTIDNRGEHDENNFFAACEEAIHDIERLVRSIVNDMNGTNILITSDHGFLFSYQKLEDYEKVEKKDLGHLVEQDRRYVVSKTDNGATHVMRIPMKAYGCDYMIFTPMENIRFKSGGGERYVHGGVSLQEMMVPVITYKNVRVGAKNFVETTNATIEITDTGRKIGNSIFSVNFYQKEPVGGKVAACTYELFFCDENGAPVSDTQVIFADKSDPGAENRKFRVRFTLKSISFDKHRDYFLVIREKDSNNVPHKENYVIDISFSAEDFF